MLFYKLTLLEVDDKQNVSELTSVTSTKRASDNVYDDTADLLEMIEQSKVVNGVKDNFQKGNIREVGREALKTIERDFLNGDVRIFRLELSPGQPSTLIVGSI